VKEKAVFKPHTDEATLWQKLDHEKLPRHIAIIMDGNGRWAGQRNQPRIAGHRAGVKATRELVKACARMGIPYLTLYAFSVDNWKRPPEEIGFLMGLLQRYLRGELDYMKRNNVRLQVIGRWRELPAGVVVDVDRAIEETRANTGLQLYVALNYSGRAELVDVVRTLVKQAAGGGRSCKPSLGEIDENDIANHLYAPELPDPDLLVRTSGELRISNFLLWQLAYTEIWVTKTHWPDFTPLLLLEAMADFQRRERRYGGLEKGSGPSQLTSRSIDSTPVGSTAEADVLPAKRATL